MIKNSKKMKIIFKNNKVIKINLQWSMEEGGFRKM